MSRPGLVRAREVNWRSDRLTGILPGKPDLVKVEWDHAAGRLPQIETLNFFGSLGSVISQSFILSRKLPTANTSSSHGLRVFYSPSMTRRKPIQLLALLQNSLFVSRSLNQKGCLLSNF